MRTRSLTAILSVLVLLGSTIGTAPTTAAASSVSLTPVQEIASDGYAASSVIDAAGAVHVVFLRYQQTGIWYATNKSGAWVSKRIAATAGIPKAAIDGSGRLYVVYDNEATDPGIYLLTNRTGAWVATRLTDQATDRFPAIAVDPLGEVHIAFGEGELVYLTDRRGYWSRRTLVPSGAYRPSIALDQNRRVHIAYEGAGTDLRYITDTNGSTWVSSLVASVGRLPSIAVQGTTPSIGYTRPNDGTGGAFYATKGSTGWTSVRIYTGYLYSGQSSLRIDAAGKAHFAFENADNPSGVDYATNATGSWVRTSLGRGGSPTVLLGPAGATLFTFATTAVYLRSSAVPAWTAASVATSAYDLQPDVAEGPDGQPRIVYAVPWTNPGLRVGTSNGTAFTLARITFQEDREPAIAVDGAGKMHIAFVRTGSPMTLWYGTDATGTWAFQQIASDAGFTCTDIALGPTGHVHVTARRTHEDAGFTTYRPVWYTDSTGSWAVRDDLPIVTGSDACPALAVDANDMPNITYSDTNKVFYTHLVSNAWATNSFGDTTFRGGAIVIAADGSIVMTYGRANGYDNATGGLYVRSNATGTWHSTLVGKTADPDARSGLALDGSGRIHVAYRGFVWDPGLHYATDTGGSWRVQRIASQDLSGPALGVDAGGQADIVFNGSIRGLTGSLIHVHD